MKQQPPTIITLKQGFRPHSRVFQNGPVHATLWWAGELSPKKPRKFLILCHGLPSHPYQMAPHKLEGWLRKGYALLYPHYIGSGASHGRFTFEGCVETVRRCAAFLKAGRGREAYGNALVAWKARDVILVGGSFGGSVVLVAGAKIPAVKSIIALAAPIDWRSLPESDESLQDIYRSIRRGYRQVWRVSKSERGRLERGTVDFNPVDYIPQLRKKRVCLIHGLKARTVPPESSATFYVLLDKGPHRLILVKNGRHFGHDILGRKEMMRAVLEWLGR